MVKCDEKNCKREATNFINEEPQKKEDSGSRNLCDEHAGNKLGIHNLKDQNKFQPPSWGRYAGQTPIG
ncbi:MAG: hypothetical protein WC451_02715 [Patescibacteria group bacterium]|jgi:hypothetical protein